MWRKEILPVVRERRTKEVFIFLSLNVLCYGILLHWCSSTQSIALLAYVYTTGFNILSLMTCVLSVWVRKQKPSSIYTFGYERFEVLAVFLSTILVQLASVFILIESIGRIIIEQPEIHTGRLLVGAGLTFFSHLIVIYGVRNAALEHVITASSSNWLQKHVLHINQRVCTFIPALRSLLLCRINPMLLISLMGAMLLFFTDLLIEMRNYHIADSFAAILIALMMCATMFPMSVYTGNVLLQTTPSHVIGQLDKCLRESLTIDGVLEFRNEHFWTHSFGKMVGSLHVRVSRDADEQLVLAHVIEKLSSVVSELTVQVFKDEWALRRGVNNGPILLPISNSVAQSYQLNDTGYKHNFAFNVSSVHTPGSWVDTGTHAQHETSYSGKMFNPHSVTSENVNSYLTGRGKEWNSSHNASINYNMNAATINKTAHRPEMYSDVPMKPSGFVNHSATPSGSSSFQNTGRMSVPLGNQPIGASNMNNSPQRTNPFRSEIPLSTMNQPNTRNNNLLLSGSSMLDSNKFEYRPH